MAIFDVLWGLLTAAGGTLALALIVTLAVGINALTLLFAAVYWTRKKIGSAGSSDTTKSRSGRVRPLASRPRVIVVLSPPGITRPSR